MSDLCLGEVVGCRSADELTWRIAKRCDSGACVEIATQDGHVMVRSSTDPDGPRITLGSDAWRGFVARVRVGYSSRKSSFPKVLS